MQVFAQSFVGAGHIGQPIEQQRDVHLIFGPNLKLLFELKSQRAASRLGHLTFVRRQSRQMNGTGGQGGDALPWRGRGC